MPIEGVARTDFGWAIVPSGLTDILGTLHDRYPNLGPVIITETGGSFHDVRADDGAVHDERRHFELVCVDFDTLERTRKDSWHWYRGVIAAQSEPR